MSCAVGVAASAALLCLCCCFEFGLAYNVDTTYPVVYQGRAGSQFGYSLSFHSVKNRKMILIGAPNDTYSNASYRARNVSRTGVVLVCTARPGSKEPCIELPVDIKENHYHANKSQHSEKSRMRLGSSVGSFGPDKPVVVCAEKFSAIWYQQMAGSSPLQFYDPVGRCLVLETAVDVATTVTHDFQPCEADDQRGWHRLGYCLTGNRIDIEKYPNGRTRMAVSSPGAFYKRGMVWLAEAQDTVNSARQVGLSQNTMLGDAQNGYGGYAVAQGDFDGDGRVEMAMSRPRANTDLTGQVWIAESEGQARPNVISEIYLLLLGSQPGEYFGHALATVDTDNDGKPELYVGSPNYIPSSGSTSMHHDYGRVTMFGTTISAKLEAQRRSNNRSTHILRHPEMILEGLHPGGHFGSTIASAGDIDNDGYNDLVIGAPYELEDGMRRGAVYIYPGSANGLESIPMQRITPLQIDPLSKVISFGSVLAKGWDIDNNSYSDLLIGAVDSDTVFMLRARPVVDIDVTMNVVDNIDMVRPSCLHASGRHITCFKVKVCGQFNGSSVYSSVEIEYELEVDKQLKFNANDQEHFFGQVELTWQTPRQCQEHVVEVKSESFNPCMPASVRLVQYSLRERSSSELELSPVLNRRRLGASKSIEEQVLLIRNCPSCSPDIGITDATLTVPGNWKRKEVVHGRTQQLSLDFVISSHGSATACSSMAKITLPPGVTFQQHIPTGSSTVCVPSNNDATEAQCNLPPLMPQGSIDTVKVVLGLGGVAADQSIITVNVNAKSYNDENGTLSDNDVSVSVGVVAVATVKASALSRPRRLRVSSGNPSPKVFSEIGPLVNHEFQVFNQGPSRSPPATVSINFPALTLDNSYILYLTKVEANSKDVVCNHTGLVNPLELGNDELTGRLNSSSLFRVRGYFRTERTHVRSHVVEEAPKKCNGYFCSVAIVCMVPQLEANVSSTISMTWRIWMNNLRDNDQVSMPANLTTNIKILQVAEQTSFTLAKESAYSASANTQIMAGVKEQLSTSPWWVWLIGFLAGFLLIALMIILLRKCKFFQRKTLAQRVEEQHQAGK